MKKNSDPIISLSPRYLISTFFSLCFIFIFLQGSAMAWNLADGRGLGARAIGMGGAYTAVADDAFALFYNPAGMVQVDGQQMQLTYMYLMPHVEVNGHTHISKEIKAPTFSMVLNPSSHWNWKRKICFGMAGMMADNTKRVLAIRYGTEYDPWYPLYGDATTEEGMGMYANMAIEIFPWLSIGGGFMLEMNAHNILMDMAVDPAELFRAFTSDEEMPVLHTSWERSRLIWKFTAEMIPMAGILIKPLPDLRLGFTFRDEIALFFDGGFNGILNAYFKDTDEFVRLDGLFELFPFLEKYMKLAIPINAAFTPKQYAIGIAYQLRENLLIAYDTVKYEWHGYHDDSGRYPNPRLEDVWVHRFGVEYSPIKNVALRFGYGYEPSPVKQQFLDPLNRPRQLYDDTVPNVRPWINYIDNDIHEFGCGAGYTMGSSETVTYKLSVYYQFNYLAPRTFINIFPNPDGTNEKLKSTGYFHGFGGGIHIIF